MTLAIGIWNENDLLVLSVTAPAGNTLSKTRLNARYELSDKMGQNQDPNRILLVEGDEVIDDFNT